MGKDRNGLPTFTSPLKVRGRSHGDRDLSQFNRSSRQSRRVMKELNNNDEYSGAETHHIIKFKSNNQPEEKKGGIQKARQAIKNRMNKKKKSDATDAAAAPSGESKCFSNNTKGIEASLGSNSLLKGAGTQMRKLKSGPSDNNSSPPRRGRSIERKLSGISSSLRRSLSMKRSLSRGRKMGSSASVGSTKSGIVEKVRSFRRQRSMSVRSIRSVRSTRSNFSTKSSKSLGKRFRGFFWRRNKQEQTERVVLVKQAYTPETVKSEPVEEKATGLFDSLLCHPFEMVVCRDLFCRPEDIANDEITKEREENDPRYTSREEESSDDDIYERALSEMQRHPQMV